MTGRKVDAEPYLAVREGYKCSKCHWNKTGGNGRTDYAKVYLETRMSASGVGSEAAGVGSDFGHGRVNEYFGVGADLRQMAEYRDFRGEQQEEITWQFGRRSTCEDCHLSSQGGGKLAEVFAQLSPLPGKASIVISQNLLPAPTTREFYGMLDIDTLNAYMKVGTFRMPTALRNTFDDPFIHGTIDQGATALVGLVGVRGDGVELGIEPGPFSVSLSVTNSETSVQASGNARAKRVHMNAYAVGSLGLLGFTWYKDPITETLERTYGGLYGGISLGRFTAMVEADAFNDEDLEAKTELDQGSLLGQIDMLVARGHNIKLQYEAFDPDRSVEKDRSDRTSLIYEPFVNPYLQWRAGARRWAGPRQIEGRNGTTLFLEVHLVY